jgi:predicted amino acid-binding ACT domain protein
MNNALAFDTYTYVKKLRDAGMNEQQAAIQAEALVNLIEERLATKADLARTEAKLIADLAKVEAELKSNLATVEAGLLANLATVEAGLKSDLAKVETELKLNIKELDVKITESKAETIKWIVSLSLAQLGLLTGILIAMIKLIPLPH